MRCEFCFHLAHTQNCREIFRDFACIIKQQDNAGKIISGAILRIYCPLRGVKKAHRSTVMQRQPTYAPKRIRLMGYGRVWIRISACGIRIGWYIMRLRSITICISLPFCLRNGFSVRRISLRLITHSIPYTESFVNKKLVKKQKLRYEHI